MTQPNSPQQLSFDLPSKPALGRDDFFVSPGNAVAVATIESEVPWPGGKLVLCGPAGSGKTHLCHVWAELSGASVVPAGDLAGADIPALADGPVAVENVPGIARDLPAQNALFHLHNLAQAHSTPLLLTADIAPNHWELTLPDLQSRMSATTITTLPAPDDALLAAVLVKLFADRQITVQPDLIAYLLKRMDRSFDAAGRLVAALDKSALSKGKPVTRKLAATVLDNSP